MKRTITVVVLSLCLLLPIAAQQQPSTTPPTSAPQQNPPQATPLPGSPAQGEHGFVEAGGDYFALSNGFGVWNGAYLRAFVTGGNHTFNGEVTGQREFGDTGVYLGAGDTYTFNPDWYGSLNLGSSVGGFFYPRFRVDGFINRKLLARRQMILSLGGGYYAAKDVHRDYSFSAGAVYYFAAPWIFETGVRFNVSTPGNVFSPSGFIAVTQGRNKHQYVVTRAGFAREAYQLIGPRAVLSDFISQEVSFTWRRWVGKSWGINAIGEYYHNPSYERGGASFGIFKEF